MHIPNSASVERPPIFEGDISALTCFLAGLPVGTFYTYVLLDQARVPFYVGKGKGRRVLEHEREALRQSLTHKSNPFKCRKIQSIVRSGQSLVYRIDEVFKHHQEAACLKREEALIKAIGRRCDGGSLTNLAAGLGSLSTRDPYSTQRHAATLSGIDPARPERTALNLFLKSLGGVDSVPIKPLLEYAARLVNAYPSPKNLTTASRRNGLTIAAAVLATGRKLVQGAPINRAFAYHPDPEDWPLPQPAPAVVMAVIENGAMSDLLKLRLATLIPAADPTDEAIVLDHDQIRQVCGLLGHRQVEEWQLRA